MALAGRGTRVTSTKQREAGRGKSAQPSRSQLSDLPLLRTSERGALKRCEFLWDLTYNHQVKPLRDAPALRYGSLIHAALADYYIPGTKRGLNPVNAFKKHYKRDMQRNQELFGMRVDEDEVWVNAYDLGIAMMEHYLDRYGKDEVWEVIVTEFPFRTLVRHPETNEPWFIYAGVIDGVWKHRRTKEFWIPDHKTTKGIGGTNDHPKMPPHLRMDDQAGAYWSWGLDYLVMEGFLKHNQLNGMLYNFLRKAMPDERQSRITPQGYRIYLNLDGQDSKKQPSPYFARMPVYRDEMDRDEARRRAMVDYRRIELLRSGELERSKTPGMFTCPGCPMIDACELHETGQDWEGFVKNTTQAWDPYAEHEIYDGR